MAEKIKDDEEELEGETVRLEDIDNEVEDTEDGGAILREKNDVDLKRNLSHFSNIVEEVDRLKSAGFEFIQEEPKRGADNKLVCFLHPKGTNGVLIELCQEIE